MLGGLLTWRAGALIGVPNMLLAMAGLTLGCLVVLETLRSSVRVHPPPATAMIEAPGPAYAFRLIRRQTYLRNVALLIGLCALTESILDYLCFGGVHRNRLFLCTSTSLFSLYVNTQGAPGG